MSVDPETGEPTQELLWQPRVGRLRLPYAAAETLAVERQLRPGLEAQAMITNRVSSRVPTLHVPHVSGPLSLASDGSGYYRELQIAVRRTWPGDQQVFVSYVRSYTGGELNEFAAVLQGTAAALLQPAGRGRLTSDVRHRMLAWATVDAPRRVVISPVVEWHSGFPYSAVDQRYVYEGSPNSCAFPAFFTTDLVVYKTLTVRHRSADFGVQVFNVTNHQNPRDVYPVLGAPRSGTFTNSVGRIVRGYMLIKWHDRG
jgi:hypothetical protein